MLKKTTNEAEKMQYEAIRSLLKQESITEAEEDCVFNDTFKLVDPGLFHISE
jgi:hypothetical protein